MLWGVLLLAQLCAISQEDGSNFCLKFKPIKNYDKYDTKLATLLSMWWTFMNSCLFLPFSPQLPAWLKKNTEVRKACPKDGWLLGDAGKVFCCWTQKLVWHSSNFSFSWVWPRQAWLNRRWTRLNSVHGHRLWMFALGNTWTFAVHTDTSKVLWRVLDLLWGFVSLLLTAASPTWSTFHARKLSSITKLFHFRSHFRSL